MPKYFYTDRLKAAWMCQEHGFDIMFRGIRLDKDGYDEGADIFNETSIFSSRVKPTSAYRLRPSLVPLLQPQAGDIAKGVAPLGHSNDPVEKIIIGVVTEIKKGFVLMRGNWGCPNESIEIIQRNGKAFFMPETSEE